MKNTTLYILKSEFCYKQETDEISVLTRNLGCYATKEEALVYLKMLVLNANSYLKTKYPDPTDVDYVLLKEYGDDGMSYASTASCAPIRKAYLAITELECMDETDLNEFIKSVCGYE